jgi:hypothetical protein
MRYRVRYVPLHCIHLSELIVQLDVLVPEMDVCSDEVRTSTFQPEQAPEKRLNLL